MFSFLQVYVVFPHFYVQLERKKEAVWQRGGTTCPYEKRRMGFQDLAFLCGKEGGKERVQTNARVRAKRAGAYSFPPTRRCWFPSGSVCDLSREVGNCLPAFVLVHASYGGKACPYEAFRR